MTAVSLARADQELGTAFPGRALRVLHVAALSAIAVAQPLYELFGATPEFFVVRDTTAPEIAVFALALVVLPPVAFVFADALVAVLGHRATVVFHLSVIALLTSVIALQVLKQLPMNGAHAVLASVPAGFVGTIAYRRSRPIRSLATVLIPAPALFLSVFLYGSAAPALAGDPPRTAVTAPRMPPIVIVVLDELPTVSLIDGRGRIDARRFPNIAAFASRSTWFRNASTVSDMTTRAVPAILSGRIGTPSNVPTYRDYPRNVFTLVPSPYDVHAGEPITRLCPPKRCTRRHPPFEAKLRELARAAAVGLPHVVLPADLRAQLPRLNESPRSANSLGVNPFSDRDAHFRAFIGRLDRATRPTLHVLHSMLPHSPWEFTPSGERDVPGEAQRYTADWQWLPNRALVTSQQRRHLRQVQFVDNLVGDLMRKLRRTGVWEDALVVVTADHGVAFRPGEPPRVAHASNLSEVAFVALFVKSPGQRYGRVDDRAARTVDIVPTIADVLGLPSRAYAGRSLLREQTTTSLVVVYGENGEVSAPLDRLLVARSRAVRQKFAHLGHRNAP